MMHLISPPESCFQPNVIYYSRGNSHEEQERVEEEEEGGAAIGRAMYLSDKPRAINFYKLGGREMMIEVESNAGLPPQQQQLILAENSGEDPEVKAPKKRAETWVQEETRTLIVLRREMDRLFNTSKSNKHLWEQISMKMRDKGFDRSPTMCTDKWRNLLKEYKKAKHQYKSGGTVKLPYYKEIDELLKCRSKHAGYKNPIVSKVDSFLQFSDKGIEDVSVPYSSLEASGRSTLNLERRVDHDGHHLPITATDAGGIPPWNWRDTSTDGDNHGSYGGRVILVKYGECTKKIGIDGSSEAIKEAIKSAFCLRTRRAFWLEDEEEVVRCLDRDMPLGSYILHLDEGVTIKMCFYEDSERMSLRTEDKTMYAEEDLHEFLARHGWTSLRELSGFRTVDTLEALRSGAMYQGVRSLGD